jgi:hypothetical protein
MQSLNIYCNDLVKNLICKLNKKTLTLIVVQTLEGLVRKQLWEYSNQPQMTFGNENFDDVYSITN